MLLMITWQHSFSFEKIETFSTIDYYDDTISLIDKSTSITTACTFSDHDVSTGNASNLDLFAVNLYEITFNYHGAKVISRHENHNTMCMLNMIDAIHSTQNCLLDSGSNVCMIKISITTQCHSQSF